VTIALNSNIFSLGQAYVALSRVRKLSEIFLSYLDFSSIKADRDAIAEYARLEGITTGIQQ
jgi:hypothetical protein